MTAYLGLEHPIRFAHRGSRLLWPENTYPAFEGAVAMGYRYLEIDVRVSADDVVVVFHDQTLDRLTNGTGPVRAWRWNELRLLDAGFHHAPGEGHPWRGKGAGIPRLDEMLQRFPDVHVNIDTKADEAVPLLAEIVTALGVEDRVLIGSFSDRRLRRFRALTGGRVATSAGPSEALAAWTASRAGRTRTTAAVAYQVPLRRGPLPVVDNRFVAAAHAAGKHVHVWTVNDPGEMGRLLDIGVDGIVTDRPDLLNQVLAARE